MSYLGDLISDSLNRERLVFNISYYIIISLLSLLTWISFYLFLSYKYPHHKKEWHCRIVTLFHGLFACCMCFYILLSDWRVPFHHINQGRASTHLMQFTFAVSLAYFIFDFVWSIWHGTEGVVMLIHHVLSILGFGVSLLVGRWGTELIATTLGSELSNPVLQMRWFLRESGRGKTSLAYYTDFTFMLLFGFNRLGMGSYLLYTYYTNPNTDFLGRLGAGTIYTIGCVFWVHICLYAYGKYFANKRFQKGVVECAVSGCGDSHLVEKMLDIHNSSHNFIPSSSSSDDWPINGGVYSLGSKKKCS